MTSARCRAAVTPLRCGTSDGTTSFVYDAENRLVQATGGRTASLAYDPLGRLWQVQAATGTTRFVYDGDRLTLEYDGSGNVLRSYVHGPDPDAPLAWYEANGPRRFLHADHQGSIVALADDNGSPVAVNAYDEYGIPQSTNLGRFGYTGQAWLPELGMYYYKARMYSPTLGRFLQTDPIGYKDQLNLYAYVGDDPVDGSDSSGENTCSLAGEGKACSGSYEGDGMAGSQSTSKQSGSKSSPGMLSRVGSAITNHPKTAVAVGVGAVAVAACVAGGCEALGIVAAVEKGAKLLGFGVEAAEDAEAAGSVGKNLLGKVVSDLGDRGFPANRVNDLMGWGSKASGAAARLESMDGAAAAAEVRGAGMTRGMAQSLRNGYQDAATRGRGVGVSYLRAQILDNILKNW